MKRLTILAAAIAFIAFAALPMSAQVVSDPNDPLYADLAIWQGRGLLSKLPPLRPYPVQLVESLLKRVERTGSPDDRARADRYLAAITGPANLRLGVDALLRASTNPSQAPSGSPFALYGQPTLSLSGNGTITRLVSYSLSAALPGEIGSSGFLLPEYARLPYDLLSGSQIQADLTVAGQNVSLGQSFLGSVAIGSDRAYFQAGLMRSSYGPFSGDNVVLSPFAPESASFSFAWQQGLFTYTALLEEISATSSGGATNVQPGKYLFLHSLEFYPLSWLTVGIIESVVWGERFEPLYLLPLSELYYAQGLIGFPDNSFAGLSGSIRLPGALSANAVVYMDDMGFDDLVRLNLNAKYKLAAQGGVSWTPSLPLLARVSADYVAVTPYTYTHAQDLTGPNGTDNPNTTNWQNYTNDGVSMATDLPPDSDRVSVSALLRPLPLLDVTLFGRYSRHGNASAGVGPGGTTIGNGTIFDPGYVNQTPTFQPNYVDPTGQPYTRFLTQAVLEKTLQLGFDGTLRFPTPIGELRGELGYTFEQIWNVVGADGTPQSGVNQSASYVTIAVGMRF